VNIVDYPLPTRRAYVDALAGYTEPRPSIWGVPWKLLDAASSTASWTNTTLLLGRAPLPDLLRPTSLHARCKPLQYSNERARKLLQWTPRWSFTEGLARSFSNAASS
jgi:hypothetical protein